MACAVDSGYPLAIAGLWPGLPTPLTSNLSAVIDILDPTKELWMPSATVDRAPVTGPKFLPLPWRGVLHTTEGGTAAGAISSFRSTNFWPHFTVEPTTGKVFQHLSLNIGARALSDHGVAANAAHSIQIEMVGFAAQTPTWTTAVLANVRALLREIEKLVPIPRTSGRVFLDASGVNHTPANRMTAAQWPTFTGWCGHQHVPGESHWDPGAIDIAALLL